MNSYVLKLAFWYFINNILLYLFDLTIWDLILISEINFWIYSSQIYFCTLKLAFWKFVKKVYFIIPSLHFLDRAICALFDSKKWFEIYSSWMKLNRFEFLHSKLSILQFQKESLLYHIFSSFAWSGNLWSYLIAETDLKSIHQWNWDRFAFIYDRFQSDEKRKWTIHSILAIFYYSNVHSTSSLFPYWKGNEMMKNDSRKAIPNSIQDYKLFRPSPDRWNRDKGMNWQSNRTVISIKQRGENVYYTVLFFTIW